MTEALLQTKLYAPPLRPNLVSRPRLIKQLNRGLEEDKKLTLVSAPAGFGKTTLIMEWRHRIPDSRDSVSVCQNPKFGWLSIDESDNDPVQFLVYLLSAMQRIIPGVGEPALAALRSPQPPPAEMILTTTVNEVAKMANGGALNHCCYMLVLDDYHVIQAQAVHNTLQFFIDHLPPPLHIAICSRADLPWSLSRLRANDQVTELRGNDLRFSLEEIADFLNRVMGLGLTITDLTALEKRTEGWIAGLQLAGLSMQGMDAQEQHEFVAAFTGSNRYIVDYLLDEVLARRPEGTQDFLLQTSILDRMSGPLCDALLMSEERSSPSTSQEILHQLEQANLFIVPLDDKRIWYRYHHLFAHLLRVRLKQSYPDRLPTLHRRASQWYEAGAYWDEAIHHALAAGDPDEAARLVEEHAMEAFISSELARLMRWVNSLPEELVRNRPWICVYHAWAMRLTGAQFSDVDNQLKAAEQALQSHTTGLGAGPALSGDEVKHLRGHIAAISAYQALYSESLDQVKVLGTRALEQLPQDNFMRSSVSLAIGWAARFNGDLGAAMRAFEEAKSVSLQHNNYFVGVSATCRLAYTQMLAGRLRQAATTCNEALQMAVGPDGQRLPVAGYALVYLGAVYCEWNRLETAADFLLEGIELCSQVGYVMDQLVGHAILARVRMGQREWDAAANACANAKALSQQMKGYVYAQRWAEDCSVRLWLSHNPETADLAKAMHWAQHCAMAYDDEPDFLHELAHMILARVLVAQGFQDPNALEDADLLLAQLLKVAEAAGWMGKVIEILVLQALAFEAGGRPDEALNALARALALGEAEGYLRVFIDEGQAMARLLYQAAERGIFPEYAGRLLAQLPAEEQPVISTSLIEPLTRRELEVMQYVATGATNAEIARDLHIAVGTVKNHVKNIYSKLNAHSRAQAIARSRDLGLIE